MALTQAEISFIQNTGQAVKGLLAMEGNLDQLNVLWAGAAQYSTEITQNDLTTSPAFNGLTTQNLADVEFALATVLNTIKAALPAFTTVAYNT